MSGKKKHEPRDCRGMGDEAVRQPPAVVSSAFCFLSPLPSLAILTVAVRVPPAANRRPPRPRPPHAVGTRPRDTLYEAAGGGGGSAPTPLCGTAVWGERKAPPSTAVAATLQSQSCCCSQQTAGWWPAGFELGAPPYGLSPPEPTPGACIRPPDLCGRLRWPYCQCWAKTPTTLTTPPPESPTLAGLPRMARRRCHGWPASHVGTMGEARVSARDGWEDTPAGVCHFPPPFSKWPSCTARRTQGQRGGGW